ncbi:hypothetical protein E3N88_11851 [Mikania micrantha]|uniref:Transferase, Chloramphenicol acetyltransferase-like domain protein n=1 Tax=Mikania micrantha TaxID=192012 RepID=A0A5N6P454_9ASTR|nr:hypothetical protein E3N88_11851 [Mikania micrantha]
MLLFYPNTCICHDFHDQMLDLKNSLSHTLTKYYPFAGRHAKSAPTFVDCNDHGTDFIEAYTDSTLSKFFQTTQNEDLDKLFPYDRTWNYSNRTGHDLQSDNVIPLAIKVTRFQCNGLAMAVSLSHKIADAYSLIRFITDWAKMMLKNMTYEAPLEPLFLSVQNTNISFSRSLQVSNDCVTRRFIFHNTKILALKRKVNAMSAQSGQHIPNPTRVEVVICLCGFPINLIDFGWGSPIKATVPGNLMKNSFVFMDAPNGEGIEVLACLKNKDMDVIQRDSELLSFADTCVGMVNIEP